MTFWSSRSFTLSSFVYFLCLKQYIYQGDLDVFGDGSVGGTLVVGGTVMGSGPYVDSSDARLKQNVRDLFSDDNGVTHRRLDSSSKLESAAINAVRALRPVRYSFNASAAPNRTFPRGEEV